MNKFAFVIFFTFLLGACTSLPDQSTQIEVAGGPTYLEENTSWFDVKYVEDAEGRKMRILTEGRYALCTFVGEHREVLLERPVGAVSASGWFVIPEKTDSFRCEDQTDVMRLMFSESQFQAFMEN